MSCCPLGHCFPDQHAKQPTSQAPRSRKATAVNKDGRSQARPLSLADRARNAKMEMIKWLIQDQNFAKSHNSTSAQPLSARYFYNDKCSTLTSKISSPRLHLLSLGVRKNLVSSHQSMCLEAMRKREGLLTPYRSLNIAGQFSKTFVMRKSQVTLNQVCLYILNRSSKTHKIMIGIRQCVLGLMRFLVELLDRNTESQDDNITG